MRRPNASQAPVEWLSGHCATRLPLGTECAIVEPTMALQAKQTHQQKLVIAPNVTLALEVLRMPTLELLAFLEHQMEENPCLEMEEQEEDEPLDAPEPSNGEEETPPAGEEE